MEKFFDLYKKPYYTPTYNKNNYKTVYGYKVLLPDEPKDELCINYGLKKSEQDINYFLKNGEPVSKRVLIPDDLGYWETDEMELFIAGEYHRRKNGVWILLNGKKYYITGVFYFFLNYWTLETGKPPVFRMSDLDFFLIWMHVVMSPHIYGLLDLKCRRIGDTEKGLCIIYEYASRVKNTNNIMQDCRTEDDIFKTYLRLTFSHEKMVWFMKPINRGTTNPKAALEFKYPEKHNTINQLKNSKDVKVDSLGNIDFEYESIGSTINYYPSVAEASDGKRHGRALIDESGKAKKMSLKNAWRFLKQTLVDQVLETLSGKCFAPTTVEDIKGSENVEQLQEFWDDADPEQATENGETTNGFIRIVRGALERGKPDRYGETDKVAIAAKIEATRKDLIAKKKFKDLISFNRQNCITIEDIFTSIVEDSGFNTENLAQRKFRLQYEIKPPRFVRGNYEWMDGKRDTHVIWMPCSNGRWVVSAKPEDWGLRSNAINEYSVMKRPQNTHAFCAGIDPYAQKDVLEKNPSKGAIVVKRKLDSSIDGAEMYDDMGDPLYGGEYFKTNRYVCAYLYRHPDPSEFYEDVIKTMVFWGSDFVAEKNHSPALLTYMELRGYANYTMDANPNYKNYKGQVEKGGVSANEKSIDTYFSYLTTLSHKWWNTIDIPEIIEQLLSTNYENRGKKDLSVAAGICEMASQAQVPTPRDRSEEDVTPAFEEHYV